MSFFTKNQNQILDSAIHNANWIIANYDFQNKIEEYNSLNNNALNIQDTPKEIILFNPFPFTQKNNLLSYKEKNNPSALFINKKKLNQEPKKIAIALVNEFLNTKQDYNLFEDCLTDKYNSIVTTIIEDLIKENKIIVF